MSPDARARWDEMVAVGRIVRPHGHRGQVVVAPDTDIPAERFRVGAAVFVERGGVPVAMDVTASREHDGRWVIALDGVADMNAAEAMRGLELRIPPDAVRALAAGEFFEHDLVGCAVRTAAGRDVGRVERIERGAGVPLLVVQGRAEVMVPLVDAICREVDVRNRVIVIDPPEGLIELNERP